jgi:tRNA-uridine 2-sulfurtransferase
MEMKKVALGMSGGVDSSLSAVLLQEAGYEVTGVFLECWRAPGCRAEEDRKDALALALSLGIPFQVLDFKDTYKQKVVEYFFDEYEKGRTPNPDVLCNKEIKFGLFYDWAMEQEFDYVATGHYAQIKEKDGHHLLAMAADAHKDQTYFLYRMRGEQLDHILFPIGHLTKPQVRELAKEKALPVATKPDSQGICFIGEINVHNFLRERLGENPGDVVDTKERVIGRHKGLWFYTIGQRHGFDSSFQLPKDEQGIDKHAIPPFYVIRKDATKNQLVVGFGAETYCDSFDIEDAHWIHQSPVTGGQSLFVRIRHTGKLIPCRLEDGKHVVLREPLQGIASGQSAVFYSNGVCLGGGVISE